MIINNFYVLKVPLPMELKLKDKIFQKSLRTGEPKKKLQLTVISDIVSNVNTYVILWNT